MTSESPLDQMAIANLTTYADRISAEVDALHHHLAIEAGRFASEQADLARRICAVQERIHAMTSQIVMAGEPTEDWTGADENRADARADRSFEEGLL